jgi:hypothetical protein
MRRGSDEDPGELADKLEHEIDELERRSQELGGEVEQVRQDWQRKRADEGVPGAVPADDAGAPAPGEESSREENDGSDRNAASEGNDESEGNDASPEREGSSGRDGDDAPGRREGDDAPGRRERNEESG